MQPFSYFSPKKFFNKLANLLTDFSQTNNPPGNGGPRGKTAKITGQQFLDPELPCVI